MAGIGDAWGTAEELLHPRGPDGRWIRKGGVGKGRLARILAALRSFRPRSFQSQGQANQFLKNVASKKPSRFQGGRGYHRLAADLGATNEDLRDGVIDNPSTAKFIKMMDDSATELPDDVILTRYVGVDAFGFTPQTAQGTSSDQDPGIRGVAGHLVADRGYSPVGVGEPRGAPPQGSVRMVIAARKGTKVVIPASGDNDSAIFLDRDQPLRVTKVESDGMGGWVMYAMTDESHGETPEPIGGPVGAGIRDTKTREASIKEGERLHSKQEKRPDEAAEQADFERRRQETEANKGVTPTPSPAQEAERRRVEQLQQQAGVQPRNEPIVSPSIGGEPRPATGPDGQPVAQTPGTPEAPAVPNRTVDLRRAVRDANVPAPAAGPNRKRFNDAYEGVISGKKDPIDAVRELDRDAADLEAAGDADADNLRQLADVIRQQYGLEEGPRAAGPDQKPGAPEVPPAPAKKAAKKAAPGGMTPDQEDRVVARAQEFRGAERNEEEQRIVSQADEILARRQGGVPVKKAAPAKAAAPVAAPSIEDEVKGLFGGKRPTNAQLREMGERNNLGFGPAEPRSEMIRGILGARPSRGRQRGEERSTPPVKKVAKKAAPRTEAELDAEAMGNALDFDRKREQEAEGPADLDKMTKTELLAEAERREIETPKSWTKDKIKAHLRGESIKRPTKKTPEQRKRQAKVDDDLAREFERREAAGEGVPQPDTGPEPAPKKAAKAAVPGAAPGTAAGKITAGRLQVGDQVLVTQNNDGAWVPSTRKTGQTRLTVEGIGRGAGRTGFRRTTTRLVLTGRDENGNEITVASVPGHQTFIAAPEPGAVPVKKAAKAAAPRRVTIGEARRLSAMDAVRENEVTGSEKHVWEQIARNVESGEWSVPRARQEAKRAARYWRESATTVRRGGGRDPERSEAAAARLEKVADRYDKLAEDLTISQSVTKTDKYMSGGGLPPRPRPRGAGPTPAVRDWAGVNADLMEPEIMQGIQQRLDDGENPLQIARSMGLSSRPLNGETDDDRIRKATWDAIRDRLVAMGTPEDAGDEAVIRQARFDQGRRVGGTLANFDRATGNEASDRAIEHTIRADGRRHALPQRDVDEMVEAGLSRDPARIQAVRDRLATEAGIRLVGRNGETVPLDRRRHEVLGGGNPTHVEVSKAGLEMDDLDGTPVVLEKAVVHGVTPQEASDARRDLTPEQRAEGKAERLVPEGSVEGTRAQTAIDTSERRKATRLALVEADLPPASPGSARKAQEEIKGDLLGGRITPEEAIRRHESEAEFLREDMAEVDANLRQTDLAPAERSKLERHKANLQESITSNEKHAAFLRDHFKEEAPVVSIKELKEVDPVSYDFLKGATPEDMREAAKEAGLDAPSGDTPDEMFTDLLKQVARKELERRAKLKTAPAKKATKKAAPPAPAVPKERERIDARLIGAGIDFDENDPWVKRTLDEAQKELDAGNETPAAIGRQLEESVRSRRTTNVYENGQWHEPGRFHGQVGDSSIDQEEVDRRKAELKTEFDRVRAQTDRMQELADRLKRTRRKPVKKAAPATPEVAKLQDKVDDLEKRRIDDVLGELTQSGDNRDRAEAALDGLTLPELRRLAEQSGVPTHRTKAGLKNNILDRFVGPVAGPDLDAILERLDSFDNPPSREDAAALLAPLSKAQLLDLARRKSIPGASGKSAVTLRRELVEGTAGARLDSIATRGFRGIRPDQPDTPAGPPQFTREMRIGARGRAAGIEAPQQPFSGVNDAEGRANQMLQAGASGTEVARMLRERAAQVAQADLNEEGRRYKTVMDMDSLRSIRKSSAEYLRRLATMLQQDEKKQRAPKKAAPTPEPPTLPVPQAGRPALSVVQGGRGDREPTTRRGNLAVVPPTKKDRSLPASGRTWDWETIQEDNMVMHGDSASMRLAQKLRRAGREDDAQYVADMRHRVSSQRGEHDPGDAEKMVTDLKAMMEAEQDTGLKEAYRQALRDIEAPTTPVPRMPADIPDSLRRMLTELHQIPAARRSGHFAGTTREISAVDALAKVLQEVETGEAGSIGTVESEIRKALRSLHESVDGAMAMWRLEKIMEDDRKAIGAWIRSHYPKAEAGRGPAGGSMAARQATLADIVSGEEKEKRRLGGGSSYMHLVTFDGGTAIHKDQSRARDPIHEQKRNTDAEELGSLVADAVGLRAPATRRDGDTKIYLEHMPGKTGTELAYDENTTLEKLLARVVPTRSGRLVGLLDALLLNGDRATGNWLLEDNEVIPIDHGLAFAFTTPAGASGSPFARHLTTPDGFDWVRENDFHPDDMAQIRARLEALQAQFEALGQGNWWKSMMKRFEILAKGAKGTERLL